MRYGEFAEVYEKLLATSKRLEKTSILAEFLKNLKKKGKSEWVYLLKGRVFPDYDPREFGISRQLAIKAIAVSYGVKEEEVAKKFNKVGDLGEIAEEIASKKKQSVLFSKELDVGHVFDNLRKINETIGKGAVDKKMGLVSELLSSAKGKESKYIIRTLLSDLRIGVADAIIVDAMALAFFDNKEMNVKVEEAFDLANDFSIVLDAAAKGERALEHIEVVPGRPLLVMLPVKVNELSEAFRICGKPAALEHKYDGFRMLIHKDKGKITLFTRKLENVTSQFPDVVKTIKEYVKGDNFIIDSEAVGYDPKTKKSKPFEAISQRIRRKYEIERLIKELPVEVNVFDVIYHNGKQLLEMPFVERRKLIEKIVHEKEYVIRVSHQIVTDDEKVAEKFYRDALKSGEEGVMIKKLDAPYRAGRRVGYIVKLKPVAADLDLVIVGAEYGSGKRAGWLSSYNVACRSENGFVEVGMVSSGLKELEGEEGITYDEMTKLLKPLITETKGHKVKVSPKVVVSVTYQNIQPSPSYSSGYAMRFPRIVNYRPDRHTKDIATIEDIKKAVVTHSGLG